MQIGIIPKRVSEEKLREKLNEISRGGESLIDACDGFEGFSKHFLIAISNYRLLILQVDLSSIKGEIATQDLAEFKLSWKGLTLDARGESTTLGLSPSDKKNLMSLNEVHNFANPDLKSSKEFIKEEAFERKSRKKEESDEKKRIKKEDKTHQEELRKEQIESDLENYGRVVYAARLHTFKAKVILYEKGYVAVGGLAPEKLLAISGSADVTKKSGVGRAAGAVLTFGTNLDANSNMKVMSI